MKPRSSCVRFALASTIALIICGASARAQSQYVSVPGAAAQNIDIDGIGELAGVSMTLRQQFLIGAAHLQQLSGKQLTDLWFRRDGGYTEALQGGAFDLQLSLSNTTADPVAPSSRFAANHGSSGPIPVFSGRVTVPASPPLGASAPWAPQNTIHIPLSQGFVYSGGTLCVDIIGSSVSGQESRFWPLDYMTGDNAGTVQLLGRSCSRFAAGGLTASAAPGTLVPGSTAVFDASGNPMMPGTWMLSASSYPGGLDLSAIGATGCSLFAGSGIMLGVIYGPAMGKRGDGSGFATVHVQLPADPALMGATVYTQWTILEALLPPHEQSNVVGVSLSNGVRTTLSSVPNTLSLATITSAAFPASGPVPASGFINCRKGPVIRFGHL